MKRIDILVGLALCCVAWATVSAQAAYGQTAESPVTVFSEADFPAADSSAPSPAELSALLPRARFANADQLGKILAEPATRLLILPYDSAYPESAWTEIYAFLARGGNLMVLGGRPFTRAAYHDGTGWHLREYSVRDSHELFIDQYQTTPGSDGLKFETNPDVLLTLPQFGWKHAFSPILHLTGSDVYSRQGSAGALDARIDPIAWGTKDGRKISSPAIQIDHLRDRFAGGRWIFLNAGFAAGFYAGADARQIVAALVDRALRGSEEFIVRPTLPLYLPGEPVEVETSWQAAGKPGGNFTARITISSDQAPAEKITKGVPIPSFEPIVFPAPHSGGLYRIDAELLEGGKTRAVYHSGFWIRDEAYLRSGPQFSVNKDYLECRKLAQYCRRAENDYVGAHVGIMDQLSSSCSVKGCALLLDCRSLEFRALPLPDEIRLVICNSMVRRELSRSAYNTRREECEEGVRILAQRIPGVRALRDVTIEQLELFRTDLPETIYRRCRHVVTEDDRVLTSAEALETGRLDILQKAMAESHRSLRDDFEVSCPELDLLVQLAVNAPGVHGARMTGAGFGGCTINLVHSDFVAPFRAAISAEYERRTELKPEIYVCDAADGVGPAD